MWAEAIKAGLPASAFAQVIVFAPMAATLVPTTVSVGRADPGRFYTRRRIDLAGSVLRGTGAGRV